MRKRLREIASLLVECDTLVDIGCDHGQIAHYALKHNLAKKVIASDISEKSLQKARLDDDRLSLRCGDGFDVLDENERIDIAVIAGMGGHTIVDILRRYSFFSNPLLLICAHSHMAVLDEFLAENKYNVIDKIFVRERKEYCIIRCRRF